MQIGVLESKIFRLYEEHNHSAPVRKTLKVFFLLAGGLRVLFSQGIVCAVCYMCEQYGDRVHNWKSIKYYLEKRLNRLLGGNIHIHKIKSLRSDQRAIFDNLGSSVSLDMYRYYLYFGSFEVASFLRERAIEAVLREQKESSHVIPLALRAALDTGRGDIVLKLVKEKNTSTLARETKDEATAMAHILPTLTPDFKKVFIPDGLRTHLDLMPLHFLIFATVSELWGVV